MGGAVYSCARKRVDLNVGIIMYIVVAPAMRTSKSMWFVLASMLLIALLATGFTTPVKASSGSKISMCNLISVINRRILF